VVTDVANMAASREPLTIGVVPAHSPRREP
jgi:hypothetical protein